ncbi:hypothetical protein niasHS_004174 [Heterodera schachtii]|uniref:B30.2/SPRY domain-containing protein n=1 Tax=Heterodera schachtii TaxID=97005 RepID=A0ABD2K001_HETSC
MTFYSPFFVFFIAIIWLGFFFECSNCSGNGKVPKNIGESSSSRGPNIKNKASDDSFEVPLKLEPNQWDTEFCHGELKISGLKVECGKKEFGHRSVFAEYPISLNKDSTGIFYFEIKKTNGFFYFGFADKKKNQLDKKLFEQEHIYAYLSYGFFINGSFGEYSGESDSINKGDVLGIGVHLNTREIFFTKNGQLLASNYSLSPSSSIYNLFPFVTLMDSDDEIEANFGQNNFKFEVSIRNFLIQTSEKFLGSKKITSHENRWDATVRDYGLRITGKKSLTVIHSEKQSGSFRTVFAENSISSNNDSNGIFYFEITIKKMLCCFMIGFGSKSRSLYKGYVFSSLGIYAYGRNGIARRTEFKYLFIAAGDVVGCGLNLATRQIIFTKNGLPFYSKISISPLLPPSALVQLFPFVALYDHEDEITANFGSEEFKFHQKLSELRNIH